MNLDRPFTDYMEIEQLGLKHGAVGPLVYWCLLEVARGRVTVPIDILASQAFASISKTVDVLYDAEELGLLRIQGWDFGCSLLRFRIGPTFQKYTRRQPLNPSIRQAVIDRDGLICGICGEEVPDPSLVDIDHIRPWSLGGRDDLDNLRVTHATCNRTRGNRVEVAA